MQVWKVNRLLNFIQQPNKYAMRRSSISPAIILTYSKKKNEKDQFSNGNSITCYSHRSFCGV